MILCWMQRCYNINIVLDVLQRTGINIFPVTAAARCAFLCLRRLRRRFLFIALGCKWYSAEQNFIRRTWNCSQQNCRYVNSWNTSFVYWSTVQWSMYTVQLFMYSHPCTVIHVQSSMFSHPYTVICGQCMYRCLCTDVYVQLSMYSDLCMYSGLCTVVYEQWTVQAFIKQGTVKTA